MLVIHLLAENIHLKLITIDIFHVLLYYRRVNDSYLISECKSNLRINI
jgi:hypothetical protein